MGELGKIPEGWKNVSISYLGTLKKGKGIRKNEVLLRGIPCVRYGELYTRFNNQIKEVFSYISEETAMTSELLNTGDIVFAGSGETAEDIGKSAAFLGNYRAYVGGDTIVLRPTSADSEYLGYALNFENVAKQKSLLGQGDAIVHISSKNLGDILFALPPLAEQKAIAKVLGDQDALIESLEKLIAKKRLIKQGTMQTLLTGQTRLPGFTEEWETVRLGDVASFLKGFGIPKSALSPLGKRNCVHYGELFLSYGVKISQTISKTNSPDVRVWGKINDVLMPTSDVTPTGLAKASSLGIDGVALGGDILVIRPNENVLFGEFLANFIRFDRKQILGLVTGSTVYHLYASGMGNFAFKLPPLAEQKTISAILSSMDKEINALVAYKNKQELIKTGLMQELLTGKTRLV